MISIGQMIARSIDKLTRAVREAGNTQSGINAILRGLAEIEHKIMSKISDYATKQTAFNDRQDAAVTGLIADVKGLKDQITKLQNTAGEITLEDQALLDNIEARAGTITNKLEALDAETAPTPPVE